MNSRGPVHPRRAAFLLVTLVLGTATLACAAGEEAPDTDFVVERATEGDVTTVRNLAGSRWGGAAVLVEELSIGLLEGDEEYMLGGVSGLWVTPDHVYVADSQVPAVRLYDHDGGWVRDIGQAGQGPGEYGRLGDLAVLPDGTVAVDDNGNRRLVFFDAEGAPRRTWTPETGFGLGLELLRDGTLLVRYLPPPEESDSPLVRTTADSVVAPLGEDGVLGEARRFPAFDSEPEPLVVRAGGAVIGFGGSFLFRPALASTVRPDGALVAGVGDDYRFEIHAPDGSVAVVERYWDPVPVHPDEAAYAVADIEARVRRISPDWTYGGDPVPRTKPAFTSLMADRDDRIWVVRHGESYRVDDCVEDPHDDPDGAQRRPCWKQPTIVDLFAPDGTYLGEVRRPQELTFRRAVFIDGDEYWAAVEDDDGLVTVRRFRIQPPSP